MGLVYVVPPMLVLAVAGLPGSGKSVVTDVARELGIPVICMGDLIREGAAKGGVTPSRYSVEARLRDGLRIFARLIIERIPRDARAIMIDGVRSIREVEALEESLSTRVTLIYVAAPWRLRFERLRARGRGDDPKSLEDFLMRDYRELRYGLGDLIARADYILVNDSGLDEFRGKARSLLLQLLSRL